MGARRSLFVLALVCACSVPQPMLSDASIDAQVRGTVSGLAGKGLVLQNLGRDDLAVDADGSFAFTTPVATGMSYSVTVKTQPTSPSQNCTVDRGNGTV